MPRGGDAVIWPRWGLQRGLGRTAAARETKTLPSVMRSPAGGDAGQGGGGLLQPRTSIQRQTPTFQPNRSVTATICGAMIRKLDVLAKRKQKFG
jgi:hypothetical protein